MSKIQALRAEIVSNYQRLNRMAHIKPKDNITVPQWELTMGNWRASQILGNISCCRRMPKNKPQEHSAWRIMTLEQLKREARRTYRLNANISGQDVNIEWKPFWMSERNALTRINKALKGFIDNFTDNNVVKKEQAPIAVHTSEHVESLRKALREVAGSM